MQALEKGKRDGLDSLSGNRYSENDRFSVSLNAAR